MNAHIVMQASSPPQMPDPLLSCKEELDPGRAITWNAAFKKAADGAGTASQRGATRFIYDGTNWLQTGGALVWA